MMKWVYATVAIASKNLVTGSHAYFPTYTIKAGKQAIMDGTEFEPSIKS
jgi:hypothetical protein